MGWWVNGTKHPTNLSGYGSRRGTAASSSRVYG
ncbi:hypothetical protein BH09ACT1_BH09ACT1_23790 [soil metagenome]